MCTNFVKIEIKDKKIFKYQMTFSQGEDGELPDGMNKITFRCFNRARKQIYEDYGRNALFAYQNLYSVNHILDEKVFKVFLHKKRNQQPTPSSDGKVEEIPVEKEEVIAFKESRVVVPQNENETVVANSSPAKTEEIKADASTPNSFQSSDEGEEYQIRIKFVKVLEPGDQEVATVTKIVLNNYFERQKMLTIRRQYFSPETKQIQNGLQLLQGYGISVGNYDKGLMMTVDTAFRVLRDTNVYDMIMKMSSRQDLLQKELIGMTVVTKYGGNRLYTIKAIDRTLTPEDSFKLNKENRMTTYYDYYKEKYNLKASDSRQPLLIAQQTGKLKKIVKLLPEFTFPTGLDDTMRKNFNTMKTIQAVTNKSAQDRVDHLLRLVREIKEKGDNIFTDWGIEIGDSPVKIEGVCLKAGNLIMGQNKRINLDRPAPKFERETQGQMFDQPDLAKWAIFYLENKERVYNSFKGKLLEIFKMNNMNFKAPKIVKVHSMGSRNSEPWIDAFDEKLRNHAKDIQIVILLMDGKKGDDKLYKPIKNYLSNDLGIPSQVVLNETAGRQKNLISVVSKIVLQISAKCGMRPWINDKLPMFNQPCMIIGLDINEPERFSSSTTTSIALVHTVDKKGAKFSFQAAKVNSRGDDFVQKLKDLVKGAIDNFKEVNKIVPKRIVLFRDGIGKGSFGSKSIMEFQPIKEIAKEMGVVDIHFIVVNKKTSSKFFLDKHGRYESPAPGSVVSEGITQTSRNEELGYVSQEFYLSSVSSRQGTPNPTKYVVITDITSDEKKDKQTLEDLQLLSYKMCFLYYNVSGSIKVPAPIQYANELQKKLQASDKLPNESLKKSSGLFYI